MGAEKLFAEIDGIYFCTRSSNKKISTHAVLLSMAVNLHGDLTIRNSFDFGRSEKIGIDVRRHLRDTFTVGFIALWAQ